MFWKVGFYVSKKIYGSFAIVIFDFLKSLYNHVHTKISLPHCAGRAYLNVNRLWYIWIHFHETRFTKFRRVFVSCWNWRWRTIWQHWLRKTFLRNKYPQPSLINRRKMSACIGLIIKVSLFIIQKDEMRGCPRTCTHKCMNNHKKRRWNVTLS